MADLEVLADNSMLSKDMTLQGGQVVSLHFLYNAMWDGLIN